MSLPAGTRLGPYEILAPIGSGGMGDVYKAKDARLDRIVAVKVLPPHVVDRPTRRQRFEREARAASRLSHPHICALYDVGAQDDVHFLVMEYLAGESLAERLKSGALPIQEALRYAAEVADALDHAHRQGIVHRDLKPANIMLTRSGAKLLDFGIARLERSELTQSVATAPADSLTEEGTILGTVRYMAPEQLEGKEADARTDIFALGAVTYEMATGRQPFDGASTASVIAAILDREPPPLGGGANIPPLLEHVVSRCLAKDPDERWQTAADVRQELKWIAQAGPPLRSGVSGPPARGSYTRIASIAIAAALAIGVVAYLVVDSGWLRRPAAGAPTYTQLTFRRGNITQARFARDGQTIFYSAAWDGGQVQIFETRPGAPASRSFGPKSAGIESVSSSSDLAVLLGCELDFGFCTGKLATMPIAGGAPREVLDNVVNADWAPDGRNLAVIHQTDGEARVEFPIGTKLYGTTTARLKWLAFSPAGDRLAFIEYPIISDEAGDLKVTDLQGRVTTLASGWRTIRAVHWSPNGDAIWFSGTQKGKTSSLYAISLSGELRLLLHVPGDLTLWDVSRNGGLLFGQGSTRARMIWADTSNERDLSWLDWSTIADLSNDGKTLLFHEWGAAVGTPVVYTRDSAGSDAVRLGDGKALALSPDGRWALGLLETPRPQLVMLATGTGGTRPLPIEGLTDLYWAKWFPDGRRLLVVASGGDAIPRSYVVDLDGGRLKQLADPGGLGVLVSPDGRHVVVRDPLGDYEMWPVSGGDPVPLPGILSSDRPIQWSPDGKLLYLHAGEPRAVRLYRYAIETKRREFWRELAPRDPAGVFGIATGRGEVAITPDGKSVVFTYWVQMDDLFLAEGVLH